MRNTAFTSFRLYTFTHNGLTPSTLGLPVSYLTVGQILKAEGNTLFKAKEYRKALGKYTKVFLWVNHLSNNLAGIMNDVKKSEPLPATVMQDVKSLRLSSNLNCVMCYLRLNTDFDKAASFVARALALDPTHKKALFRKAQVLLRMNVLTDAEKGLQLAQVNFPNDATVEHEVQLLKKKQKKLAEKERKQFSGMFDKY